MIYRLVMLTGARKGQQVTVQAEAMTVGRDPECALFLDDPEIATAHAEVAHTSHGLKIRDLGSMGKILVNNREVRESLLKHGDTVDIGQTRMLVQAVVEAEVRDPRARRKLRPRLGWRPALAALILIGAAALYVRAILPHDPLNQPVPVGLDLADDDLPEFNVARTGTDELSIATDETGMTAELAPPVELARDVAAVAATPAPPVELPVPPVELQVSAPPPPPPELPVGPAPDPSAMANAMIDAKARDMMMEVYSLAGSNRVNEADELLGSILRIAPDYLEAYAERAWMYEERGMLRPALDQWLAIIARGGNTNLITTARSRVEQLQRARREPLGKFGGQLRVVSSDQRKFPETDDVREMRIMTAQIQPRDPNRAIDGQAVRIEVQFYDQAADGERIRPTRATVLAKALPISGSWQDAEVKTITATYSVPTSMAPTGRRAEQFFGYVIRVYYYEALQDVYCQPRTLLARVSPPKPTAADTKTITAEAPRARFEP